MTAPFVSRMPVRFADVDHAGIVYYPVFFHYFHVAFEEFFRDRLGPRAYVDLLDRRRIGFPSVSAGCDYQRPLRFGDTVEVEMAVERLGGRSITFGYRVFRAADAQVARELAAEGRNTCAVVDLAAFRAVEIPADIRALLAAITVETGAEVG
jgi:4-hydroxybenzoyl-CoA thioesterase